VKCFIGIRITRLDVSADVVAVAGALALHHPLRGADAVHLASAYLLGELYGSVRFLSFDKQLNAAAERLVPVA
jgi:predicted nucleic acid-binding protein